MAVDCNVHICAHFFTKGGHSEMTAECVLQGRLIALFTSDAQVIAQATAVLPLIAAVMVRLSLLCSVTLQLLTKSCSDCPECHPATS